MQINLMSHIYLLIYVHIYKYNVLYSMFIISSNIMTMFVNT
jgi:hypothetical protein